jgi:hypothetical protein
MRSRTVKPTAIESQVPEEFAFSLLKMVAIEFPLSASPVDEPRKQHHRDRPVTQSPVDQVDELPGQLSKKNLEYVHMPPP